MGTLPESRQIVARSRSGERPWGRTGNQGGASRQRGIALLTAIILVAVATMVATAIAFNSGMSARRSAAVFSAAQSLQVAEGAEALAAYVLKQGQVGGAQQDSPDGAWAMPYGPTQIESGVTLEAQLEDQQGKFNLNNLVDQNGLAIPAQMELFVRLLENLGLETKWAQLMVDWIDADNNPTFPDGAEDSTYLGQSPPYRTPNVPISSVSEMLALPGFGRQRYDLLVPYIAALPPGTAINVCTASGMLLDAVSGKSEYSLDPQRLTTRRQSGCYPTLAEFNASLAQKPPSAQPAATILVDNKTHYFRLWSRVTIGTAQFSLYSLLLRDNGQIRPILRTFGTE